VQELGGEVRKVRWIGRRGAPDRLVMLPRRRVEKWSEFQAVLPYTIQAKTIWVELKAPGVEPEPHQLREHKRMREMGQRVEVIDSLAGVEELFK
jgi:hypothetical protein